MTDPLLKCIDDRRRQRLQSQSECTVNGIDYVEVCENHARPTLTVFFHNPLNTDRTLSGDDFVIEGGRLRTGITVDKDPVTQQPPNNSSLKLQLSGNGDPVKYRLRIKDPNSHKIDPRFAAIEFTFPGEGNDLAGMDEPCPERLFLSPRIDYLARDYGRIRRLLLDRLSVTLPEWRERHIPDIGLMLVELFAYVGDHLSYHQDAVATEAYLGTARRRVSVRRHTRLVDYVLHEGCNSRSFLHINAPAGDELDPHDVFFIAGLPEGDQQPPEPLSLTALREMPSTVGPLIYFEPVMEASKDWQLRTEDILDPHAFLMALATSVAGAFAPLNAAIFNMVPELAKQLRAYDYSPTNAIAETLEASRQAVNSLVQEIQLWHNATLDIARLSAATLKRIACQALHGCPACCNRAILEDLCPDLIARRVTREDRIRLFSAHNEIHFYTWDGSLCWLPQGATSATLRDWYLPTRDTNGEPQRALSRLGPGDLLLFEEVKGSRTGNPADADKSHRQVVRLTKVTQLKDPLVNVRMPNDNAEQPQLEQQPLLEIEWHREDALRFPLCLSAKGRAKSDCGIVEGVSVARGNMILVDHGLSIRNEKLDCHIASSPHDPCADPNCCGTCSSESPPLVQPRPYRPFLDEANLTYRQPIKPLKKKYPNGWPASLLLAQQKHKAEPSIWLTGLPPSIDARGEVPDCASAFDPGRLLQELRHNPLELCRRFAHILPAKRCQELAQRQTQTRCPRTALTEQQDRELADRLNADIQSALTWTVKNDVLNSRPGTKEFTLEVDDERRTQLRFIEHGPDQPPVGTHFWASYRSGNGATGNVGAEGITHIGFRSNSLSGRGLSVRNPLAATGGTDPEDLATAKLMAPHINRHLKRAVTADDYATLVTQEFPHEVQRAKAQIHIGLLGQLIQVAIDPFAKVMDVPDLLKRVKASLDKFRRIGHDIVVIPPQEVPLNIAMQIGIHPGYQWEHVHAALRRALNHRDNADGTRGFFHPDNRTFGDAVYLSEIITKASQVIGVRSVEVKTFGRGGQSSLESQTNLNEGRIPLAPLEVAVLNQESGKGTLELREE